MVKEAYDRLINATNVLGKDNPRFAVYEKAKNTLCDPVARRDHAEEHRHNAQRGENEERREAGSGEAPPWEPRESGSGEAPPWEPRESGSGEAPPWWKRGRLEKPGSGEAAPWWMGGLLAMPAALLYVSAGLTFMRTPEGSPLDMAALVVAVLTFRFLGLGWLQLVFVGSFLMAFAWFLAGLSVDAFASDMASWSVAPEIGVVGRPRLTGLGFRTGGLGAPARRYQEGVRGGADPLLFRDRSGADTGGQRRHSDPWHAACGEAARRKRGRAPVRRRRFRRRFRRTHAGRPRR